MPYAAMLIIGGGTYSPETAVDTAAWHQDASVWLSNHKTDLPPGTPVVARMGGPSNELLIDGLVAGQWRVSKRFDEWELELPVVWSRHVVRGVRARDVLGERGVVRSAHVELTHDEWRAIQTRRLSA